jgi:hypothetical protein
MKERISGMRNESSKTKRTGLCFRNNGVAGEASGCYDKLILFVVSSGRPLPGSTIRKFSLGSYFSSLACVASLIGFIPSLLQLLSVSFSLALTRLFRLEYSIFSN